MDVFKEEKNIWTLPKPKFNVRFMNDKKNKRILNSLHLQMKKVTYFKVLYIFFNYVIFINFN